MFKRICIIFCAVIIFINLVICNIYANTFNDKGYYDFEGVIGKNYKILLSVYYNENKFTGSYYYDKYRKEIDIDGKIEGEKILLTEYDQFHNKTGIFNGVQKQDDSIAGIWQDVKGNKKLNFNLKLYQALPGCEYGHRYRTAGFDNDKAVEQYVQKFQNYIKKGDRINISNLIKYPLNAKVSGERIVISNKKQFVDNYDNIFTEEFKNIMEKTHVKYMFANCQGVMFGSGSKNIWINNVLDKGRNEGFHIIAVNNE